MSDNKTDANLKVIYSPVGEKFEVTPENHRDLIRHAKWTEHKPHPDAVREYCATHGVELPADVADAAPATPAPAPAPEPAPAQTEAPTPSETPAPAQTEAPTPSETPAPAETSGEAPEEVEEADAAEEGDALKAAPSDFADMDRDAVKAYITDNFPGTEIDGRKGRDALVAQALELAAARA